MVTERRQLLVKPEGCVYIKLMRGNCPSPIPCPDHEEFTKHGGCSLCPNLFPKPAPKPANKRPAKGDAQGKKKKHTQQVTMRYSLAKKGFISDP